MFIDHLEGVNLIHSKVTMKYVALMMFVVLAVSHVTWGGPAPQLRSSQDGAEFRVPRQSGVPAPNTPLAQLLQDALNIPQVALQAVSRLLTNPSNTIGVSTNGRQNNF
ncbi:hypothetical protein B566_EDAN012908 [Ephemera danica]|nr:hypothetical protein B566_EDAN012908 [Ephemera danica]